MALFLLNKKYTVISQASLISTDLVRSNTARVQVWVSRSRVNGILVKVLVNIFRGSLRQESINALSYRKKDARDID